MGAKFSSHLPALPALVTIAIVPFVMGACCLQGRSEQKTIDENRNQSQDDTQVTPGPDAYISLSGDKSDPRWRKFDGKSDLLKRAIDARPEYLGQFASYHTAYFCDEITKEEHDNACFMLYDELLAIAENPGEDENDD